MNAKEIGTVKYALNDEQQENEKCRFQ